MSRIVIAASMLALVAAIGFTPAQANFAALDGAAALFTVFSVDGSNLGSSDCAGAGVECPSSVPIDATGALFGVTANPFKVSITNGSIAVTAASLPLPSGAATSALQTTINTTLGTPFQANGAISNSSFGISGPLPAFAATPTFDLGDLNGAALDSNLTALKTANHTDLAAILTAAQSAIPAQSSHGANIGAVEGQVASGSAVGAQYPLPTGVYDGTNIRFLKGDTSGDLNANLLVGGTAVTATANALDSNLKTCAICNNNGAATIGNSTPVGLPSDQFGLSTDTASTVTNGSAATLVALTKEISAMEQAPVSRPVTNAGTFAVQVAATTSGGASVYHKIALASDNHVVIKNGAGTAYGIDATAGGTGVQYVRLYDAGTGFNGCNSATGILWGQQVPAAAAAAGVGGGYAIPIPAVGIAYSTGLSICITGAVSDTDTTAAATTTVANVLYK